MRQVIIFINNNQSFALDISSIERIIEFQRPKRIPEASQYLLGVIKYNEKILPIIDLNMRFFNINYIDNDESKIIVVIWKDKKIGILVNEIVGIKSIADDEFEESNLQDSSIAKEYVLGFIKTTDDITMMLDINSIFNFDEEIELLTMQGETGEL
ncbi:MAG: chemotaxis protein CheW [Eubacteriaceae bacterium]